MAIKTCDVCGAEFECLTYQRTLCDYCQIHSYDSLKKEEKRKKTNPNQKLIDDVREATKRGLSYGNYKGRL